jgi:hypothetical protein
MEKRMYSHAEINEILSKLRHEMELELTLEKCMQQLPRNSVATRDVSEKVFDHYEEVSLTHLMDLIKENQAQGANTVELRVDYDNDDPKVVFKFQISGPEEESAYTKRVKNFKHRQIEEAIRKKNEELRQHNRDFSTFQELQRKFSQ